MARAITNLRTKTASLTVIADKSAKRALAPDVAAIRAFFTVNFKEDKHARHQAGREEKGQIGG